jgi:hypothetical protein
MIDDTVRVGRTARGRVRATASPHKSSPYQGPYRSTLCLRNACKTVVASAGHLHCSTPWN